MFSLYVPTTCGKKANAGAFNYLARKPPKMRAIFSPPYYPKKGETGYKTPAGRPFRKTGLPLAQEGSTRPDRMDRPMFPDPASTGLHSLPSG